MDKRNSKTYSVAIDTVPLPEKPAQRVEIAARSFGPVVLEMMRDAMSVAVGTWPTPESPAPTFEARYGKKYSVSIDTVPLPEEPAERVDLSVESFGPVLMDMMRDAMSVAIGTWPTPEDPGRP